MEIIYVIDGDDELNWVLDEYINITSQPMAEPRWNYFGANLIYNFYKIYNISNL